MTAPLYKPPTTVTTMQTPWLAFVTRADPDWGRERHREPQYEFTKRIFYVNQDIDGAYSQYSNPWQQGTAPQLESDYTAAILPNPPPSS